MNIRKSYHNAGESAEYQKEDEKYLNTENEIIIHTESDDDKENVGHKKADDCKDEEPNRCKLKHPNQ